MKKLIIVILIIIASVLLLKNGLFSENFTRFVSNELPAEKAAMSAEKKLLGNWSGKDNKGATANFKFENGEFKIVYPEAKRSMSGIYLVDNDSTILLNPTEVDGQTTSSRIDLKCGYHFQDDNTLILNLNGTSATLKRK